MRAKVLSFVQMKGGAGKTTLCSNIASTLSESGNVLMIDTDVPQCSLKTWYDIRNEGYVIENLDVLVAKNLKHLQSLVRDNINDYEYILIDGHPRITNLTRAVILLSDAVLIPMAPSQVEVWSTKHLAEIVEEAKQINNSLEARICWNRYRVRTNSAEDVVSSAKKELGLEDFSTKLGNRVAYLDSFADGLTVAEWHDPAAKLEIWALTSNIERLLAKQGNTRLKTESQVEKFVKGK
ncbi:ParA family protein [Kangiella sediminilitoris]|uniref:Cobyrinic acid ac-diamide synthase n=1 Tax=Kangiella sediminilitoris TaxID=1144748 RepID=A0A1B3BBD6_9GAMM|nr:ParA family protein [Kangiella sediminilitoris]AOE50086.1 Cobyrinic acid ac-diamide synthase [Kangiella sediminilitoris]